jgi:deoxyhypusine monooxygenase
MSQEEFDADNATLEELRDVLINKSGTEKLSIRYRALFNLKSIGKDDPDRAKAHLAIQYIAESFGDDSELLKHEVAYVLGQTRDLYAAPFLRDVVESDAQQVMVRHEAAEALGALGDKESLPLLEKYFREDPSLEIRQTCELAIDRINWEHSDRAKTETIEENVFYSIDPAPPLDSKTSSSKVEKLQAILNDQDAPLFERYRAMFRLRDLNTDEACLALCTGFLDPSALFKHEIAYVLGQLSNPVTVPPLIEMLQDDKQEGMVRHEAAEALGSIATDEVLEILQKFSKDELALSVVRDSAIVALDMYEYENSNEFEYATVN